MNNKILVITLLLLSSFIALSSSIGNKSISYVLEDQYGNEHKSVNIQGKRQLLFLADRSGSDFTSNWTKVLEPLYRNTIEFVAFVSDNKKVIEKQLCKVNNLNNEKVWIPQLNLFLGLIGLSLKKEKSKWSNGKKTYLYSLDQDPLQQNQEIVKRRKQFSDHVYSTLYWKNVHKVNDFQTPIVVKVSDESGIRLMPLSDLEERFKSKQMDSTQKADYDFLTKLVNED